MDFLLNLAPHLVNGIGLGLLFALIALGFMLIVGVMEVINLAHGSLFALGAYFAMMIIGLGPEWFGPMGEWYVGLPAGLRYSFGHHLDNNVIRHKLPGVHKRRQLLA